MKIKESYIRELIQKEFKNLTEDLNKEEESKIAHIAYIFLSKAREKFEEYLGNLPEEEKPSDEFRTLFDAISEAWQSADKILTGGETRDALPELFEHITLIENRFKNFETIKDWMQKSKPHPEYDQDLYREWQGVMLALGDLKPMPIPGGFNPEEGGQVEPGEASRPTSWPAPATKVRFVEQEEENK